MRSSVPPRSSPSQENRWHRLKGRRLADTGGRHLLDDEQARRSRTTDAPTPATEPAHAIARPEVHDERCRLRTFSSTRPSAEVPISRTIPVVLTRTFSIGFSRVERRAAVASKGMFGVGVGVVASATLAPGSRKVMRTGPLRCSQTHDERSREHSLLSLSSGAL